MNLSIEKSFFVISLISLSMAYGLAAGRYEWFPYHVADRALDQARVVFRSYNNNINKIGWTSGKVYDNHGITVNKNNKHKGGFLFLSSSWEGGEGREKFRLIDRDGKIIHKWSIEGIFSAGDAVRTSGSDIHGSKLMPNGDIVFNQEWTGTARVDACGDVEWVVKEGGHHSVEESNDGGFWVPGVSKEPRAGSDQYPNGYPGLDKKVYTDRALKIGPKGELKKDINLLDVIYKNNLTDRIVKAYGPYANQGSIKKDILHTNDINQIDKDMAKEYKNFEKGDLLVSMRHLNLVFVLDTESKKVKWHTSNEFTYQHDPELTGEGWIGIFDNNYDLVKRGGLKGGSRIVAVNANNESVKNILPNNTSNMFYTSIQGKWSLLENNNILLVESQAGRVVEVNPDGETVWEWIHEPLDQSTVPVVTNATRHEISYREVASWPCSLIDSISTPTQN